MPTRSETNSTAIGFTSHTYGAWSTIARSTSAQRAPAADGSSNCAWVARSIIAFGAWVEQLIAESTGKEGKGILPVTGEDLGPPKAYGSDRLFVAYGEHEGLEGVEARGHPVIRIADGAAFGGEFFRWEFATAVAGHVLDINPFDQPNVEEAKRSTKQILESGPGEAPGVDDVNALLGTLRRRDYVAIQAYVDPNVESEQALQRARLAIRDRYKVATTLGFGPRYLHSTGQFHKGGPDTGVFVQVVDRTHDADVPIPGAPYTFGKLIDAQALGDLLALRAQGRRVGRVTLEQLEEVG